MSGRREIEVIRLQGLTPYRDAYALQMDRRDGVIAGTLPEAVFLLEHEPVVTLGREAREENLIGGREGLARLGIEVAETDRGGDVTYHGPGQVVAYPILDLNPRKMAIRVYLRTLEEIVIDMLAEYGLKGEHVRGLTGVWVGGGKVAAIGVGARRWVTYHGVALNVDPNMEHWAQIVPCGIADKPVTSLRALLGEAPSMEDVQARLERQLLERFS